MLRTKKIRRIGQAALGQAGELLPVGRVERLARMLEYEVWDRLREWVGQQDFAAASRIEIEQRITRELGALRKKLEGLGDPA